MPPTNNAFSNFDVLDADRHNALGGGPSFALKHRLLRLLWRVTWLAIAAWTPRVCGPWRRWLLIQFGARMGRGADVRGGARIWYPPNLILGDHAVIADGVNCYNLGVVELGDWALVSQRAVLCGGTHDYNNRTFQIITKPILIGRQCWVASEAFVGPGGEMGEGAVLGARAVACKKLEPWTVYAGNPARPVKSRKRVEAPDLEAKR